MSSIKLTEVKREREFPDSLENLGFGTGATANRALVAPEIVPWAADANRLI